MGVEELIVVYVIAVMHRLSWEPLCDSIFVYSCIKSRIGTQGEVYTTDRSGGGPGVDFTLCSFVVYFTRRIILSLALRFVLVFFSVLYHCDHLAWG